ncbi:MULTISPECIES: hypothetical protein [Bacillaceae]|uniref:Uncharacterized protein n=1 Tax=Evansella alkalicola TaxID=745819 RepID=A0ABS6JN52_9BACI|nr:MULTISPECIES: hypothetical protein [Bacillaceae]MBU9719845.1 hypothetical protein [Bacillus alkalicola]
MKKIVYLLMLIVMLFLIGCSDDRKESHSFSPAMAASGMSFLAGTNEVFYGDFEELFDPQLDASFVREKYELVNRTKADRSSISTLAYITYENGKSLLVQLRHDPDPDKYYIYNVIEVPEDVAAFFEEEL